MGIKKTTEFTDYMEKTTTVYNIYDSGEEDATTSYQTITPSKQISQLLIYPAVEARIKLDDSTKEIFLPANVWTPVSVACDSFKIKGASESGKIYWQGWIL